MSENVSSNVLFHFTKSMRNLKGILKNGFFPRYCPEYALDHADSAAAAKGRPPMHAALMVSFCDLPLSLIRKHLIEYGPFGIGLRKTWGVENGVTPVLYTHHTARTRRLVSCLTINAAKAKDETAVTDLQLLSAFTKPFEGRAWRKSRVQKEKIRFYDEREWRYVPEVPADEKLFLDWKDYENPAKRRELHRRFEKRNALKFQPADIQYLILPYDKGEEHVLELHDYVMRLYGQRYSRKDAVLVGTSILTEDCIEEDV